MPKRRANTNQPTDPHGLEVTEPPVAAAAAAAEAPSSNPQSAEHGFDLDAGSVCLDFVNTLAQRSGEHLNGYADLVTFAEQSGLLSPAEGERLRAEASRKRHIKGAGDVMARAKRLRAALHGIFAAVARGATPAARDVAALNRDLSISLRFALVETAAQDLPSATASTPGPVPVPFVWSWDTASHRLDEPLWPIGRSAADLLTSPEQLQLVRECGAEDCRWLFLDTSKNRTRQWCSMTSCGNREKARRHYERVRSRRGTPERATADAARSE